MIKIKNKMSEISNIKITEFWNKKLIPGLAVNDNGKPIWFPYNNWVPYKEDALKKAKMLKEAIVIDEKLNLTPFQLLKQRDDLVHQIRKAEIALRDVRDYFLNLKENLETNPQFVTDFLRSSVGGNSVRANLEQTLIKISENESK